MVLLNFLTPEHQTGQLRVCNRTSNFSFLVHREGQTAERPKVG